MFKHNVYIFIIFFIAVHVLYFIAIFGSPSYVEHEVENIYEIDQQLPVVLSHPLPNETYGSVDMYSFFYEELHERSIDDLVQLKSWSQQDSTDHGALTTQFKAQCIINENEAAYWKNKPFIIVSRNASFELPDIYTADNIQIIYPAMCKCCGHASQKHTRIQHYKKLLPLIHSHSASFYHMTAEALPRLALAASVPGLLDNVTVLLSGRSPFIMQYMEFFNVSYEIAEPDVKYTALETLIPSFMGCGKPTPEPIISLRNVILGQMQVNYNANSAEIVVIVRRKKRSIANQAELVNALRENFPGEKFAEVVLEKLPIRAQIEHIAHAKAIISPHGAGLTHLIFASPNSVVIEFLPGSYLNGVYCYICRLLNIRYWGLIVEGYGFHDIMNVNVMEAVATLKEGLSHL